jgi:hypothetical protein
LDACCCGEFLDLCRVIGNDDGVTVIDTSDEGLDNRSTAALDARDSVKHHGSTHPPVLSLPDPSLDREVV